MLKPCMWKLHVKKFKKTVCVTHNEPIYAFMHHLEKGKFVKFLLMNEANGSTSIILRWYMDGWLVGRIRERSLIKLNVAKLK